MARTKNKVAPELIAEQIEDSIKPKQKEKKPKPLLIPTGSTMLNLACSDSVRGGYKAGTIINLIGDSSSGKTALALAMFADMTLDSSFADYRFVYDDVEGGIGFDIQEMFGEAVHSRIEYEQSDTIEDFQDSILRAAEDGAPFIYILDSYDALDAKQDQEKTEEERKARDKGKDVAGSYGVAKTKKLNQVMRSIKDKIKNSKSLLVIISQTRDNINPMSFKKKRRAGENALEFYSSHCIWLALATKEKKKDQIIGVNTKAKVDKNRLTGKRRQVSFTIYYDYGVDCLGSGIDFFVSGDIWKKSKNSICATELDVQMTKAKLIEHIETNNLENKFFRFLDRAWKENEESLKLNRKKKYE